EQQGQQNDLEVSALRLAEAGMKGGGELAQALIHAYNRDSHSGPRWFQAGFDTLLVPHRALCCNSS
ncbi:MAG: hypothetical protein M3380_11070, partial [Chloroflexota bacterium]|nr:hypothetical protein [Chloroflexota bacterium]